jgi:RsiW-degrading membrane proteinase PrsW (M82 family)
MTEANPQKVNWVGAGLSLAWMGFFITCMFIRTNFPETSFSINLLNGSRAIWTLVGSFLLGLLISMVVSALLARRRKSVR